MSAPPSFSPGKSPASSIKVRPRPLAIDHALKVCWGVFFVVVVLFCFVVFVFCFLFFFLWCLIFWDSNIIEKKKK